MISPKHRKAEMTQKHVVRRIEEKRMGDKANARAATAKIAQPLIKQSLFAPLKRRYR